MRKNILYAARVQGDLELGLEPSRIRGTVKDWARSDFPGEHIPGRPEQEIWEQSAAATPNYRVGTRRVQDERTYHYCRADTDFGIEKAYYGAQDYNVYNSDGSRDCLDNVVSGDHAAGGYTLLVLDTNANHTEDWFAGGWVWVYSTSWVPQWLRVRSSTAQAATGTSVTLTLWDPIIEAIADTRSVTVYPSIYSKVQRRLAAGSEHAATVCVPPIRVTAGRYFWGQTWGPCVGVPNIAVPGVNPNERNLVFNFDGSLRLIIAPAAPHYEQLAGFNLLNPIDVQPDGWFPYMLQLAP